MFQSSPAPRRGRSCRYGGCINIISLFQSSPAPRRGRSRIEWTIEQAKKAFQSSPAPRRGRSPFGATDPTALRVVSILARAEARALRNLDSVHRCDGVVSILARAEARALLRLID